MEFNFSVNALFKDQLSKVKNNLLPENYVPDRRGDGDVAGKVAIILDKMGVVSAKAQNLPHVITTAAKLRNTDHTVYILTDPEGNRGHGAVLGILKVGFKKLFTYDLNGTQWEQDPLCVLDFYIYEPKQRMGYGKMLFSYMLQDQEAHPEHLALDQPSESFLSFMCKNYGLDSIIPQNNSFVVYDGFFKGRSDKRRGSDRGSAQAERSSGRHPVECVKASSRPADSPLPTYGRHSARKAESTMGQYMQDAPQNGSRQHFYATNPSPASPKMNSFSTKPQDSSDTNGTDSQSRPTSFPSKLNGPSPPPQHTSRTALSESQMDDVDGPAKEQNGTEASPQEDFPAHLDLKFHHTHLCKYSPHLWDLNQHNVPLAQYGHYWSTVGELLSEEPDDENDGSSFSNGDSAPPRVRRVSNVPIGTYEDDEDEIAKLTAELGTKQNGCTNGTSGVRDVRIKKTMFHNLSPFRN